MNTTETYDPIAAEAELRGLADAYYNKAQSSPISDAEFDTKIRRHREYRAAHPEGFPSPSILDAVGAAPSATSGFVTVKHRRPMLSLDNVFELEDGTCPELSAWLSNLKNAALVEPKIDGCSLSLIYEDGILTRAVTRGDGEEGDDITSNIMASRMVPWSLPDAPPTLEVRGEVYMSFEQFEKLNAELKAAEKPLLANPRNAAAGAMRQSNPAECAKRGLSFIAYDADGFNVMNDQFVLAKLDRYGFEIPAFRLLLPEEPGVTLQSLKDWFGDLHYPIDGLVVKVNNHAIRQEMGMTSRAPRWAVAIKFQQEKVSTVVNAITVQVGRTGVLTPVAELEPVWVDGSTVSRATLHNQSQIDRLKLRVGDTVEIRKAAAIIPEVVRSISAVDREDGEGGFSLIRHIDGKCPSCGSTDIELRNTGKDAPQIYACVNSECPAQLAAKIQHFCSRAGLNIDGIGEEASAAIADAWADFARERNGDHERSSVEILMDLVDAPSEWLAELTWMTDAGGWMTFGGSRAQKAVKAFNEAKRLPLHRWLTALGIHTVGENTSKEVSRIFKRPIDLVRQYMETDVIPILKQIAAGADKTKGELAPYKISHHLGPVSCQAMLDFIGSAPGAFALAKLAGWDVESDNWDPIPADVGGKLAGQTFAITGTLSMTRDEMKALIEAAGGKVSGTISKKLTALICGEGGGGKRDKAAAQGIKTLDEAGILALM